MADQTLIEAAHIRILAEQRDDMEDRARSAREVAQRLARSRLAEEGKRVRTASDKRL